MQELKPGDIVRDGAGTRGRVIRVEHLSLSPHATNSRSEQIYVDWFVGGDELPYPEGGTE